MTCPNCCCPDDCCDQIVPVTQENNTYNIDSAAITPVVAQVSGTEVLVTLQSDVLDFQNMSVYFVDNPALPTLKTVSPPPDPGWIEKTLGSTSTGLVSLTVINTGATDTWYLIIQGLNGVLVVSDAITIGV